MIKAGFLENEIRKQGAYRIEMDAALDYANKAQLEVGGITNPRNKPVIMVFADDESMVNDLLTSKTNLINPYWQILENSSRNFPETSVFRFKS